MPPSATPLSALDAAFVLLDRPRRPQHVAYLNLLTPPADASTDFAQNIVRTLRGHGRPQPPFNLRLAHGRLGLHWVEDDDFDIDQHLVHLVLPRSASLRELMQVVARLHAAPLDRSYPLWRMHVIEGLADGRLATYAQLHHSVADGIAATRLVMKSMSRSPRTELPPLWTIPPKPTAQSPATTGRSIVDARRRMAALAHLVSGLPGATRALTHAVQAIRAGGPDSIVNSAVPTSILNRRISGSRQYAAGSFALPRVKALGRTLSCTVNDIVLAMCAAALRSYLLDVDALPERPLIAGVPFSLRRDPGERGNQIVFLRVVLGTDLADPLQRFERIKRSVDHGKQHYARMTPAEVIAYNLATLAPAGLNLLCGLDPRRQPFNVVISNTPGPRTPLYWHGCRLEAMYPASVLADGQALNISLTRRHDALDFGILACRRSLPHVGRLIDDLEGGLAALESAVFGGDATGVPRGPRLVRGFTPSPRPRVTPSPAAQPPGIDQRGGNAR